MGLNIMSSSIFCIPLILMFSSFSEANSKPNGVFVPVFTPIDKHGHVDLSVIPEYAAYLKHYGLDGVVGSTGEGPALTLDERKQLVHAWVKHGHGLKVMSHVGGQVFSDVLEMAEYSESLGVYAILALPEIYFKPKTPEEVVMFLEKVADAAPHTPIIYYDYPEMTGVMVDLAKTFALATAKIPNFGGTKSNLPRSMEITAINTLKKYQKIYISQSPLLAAAYGLGFNAYIGAASNVFPGKVLEIIKAAQHGDMHTASMLQDEFNTINAVINSEGDSIPTMKAAMEMVSGIKVGDVRFPLIQLTSQQKKNMAMKLTKLGVKLLQEKHYEPIDSFYNHFYKSLNTKN